MSARLRLWTCLAILWGICGALAQDESGGDPPGGQGAPVIAATVDGRPLYGRDVELELQRLLRGREATAEAEQILRAEALRRLVDRQLVLRGLERGGQGASSDDLDQGVSRLRKQLARQGKSLAEYLREQQWDEDRLRRELAWQIGWPRALRHYLTDENLERFFLQHRREFDGTQIRAAHILLKVDPPDSRSALEQALARCGEIRERIIRGELTFAAAAKEYSQAPTGEAGGQIGCISRHEPMPEPFSLAAFALEENQISQPVLTPFGVHLIRCEEIKPGDKPWTDVREQLEAAAAEHLFRWLADQQRPTAAILFSGAAPHFRPGTQQLADEEQHAKP